MRHTPALAQVAALAGLAPTGTPTLCDHIRSTTNRRIRHVVYLRQHVGEPQHQRRELGINAARYAANPPPF